MTDLTTEIHYKTARSGGSGGQNVNKVETMAEAIWHVANSQLVTDEEKACILSKLGNKLNKEGYLSVRCSETRSQLENKQIASQKLEHMVAQSLVKPKKRRPTRIPAAVKEKRLNAKKLVGEKKGWRKPPSHES